MTGVDVIAHRSSRTPAILALEDGSVFRGTSIGAEGASAGEVVFNTAMTGYQEILTDPSYAGQIVTLTYPHIGNTGINAHDMESDRVWAAGLVIRDLSPIASSWRSELTLEAFLRAQKVVAITDVDTRRLTRLLRERGALNGCLVAGASPSAEEALARARAFPGLEGLDLAREVTCAEVRSWEEGSYVLGEERRAPPPARFRVVAYDFGIKRNMLRLLVDRGCEVTVVPAQTPAAEVRARAPDGVLLSNGPGDPEPCDYAIEAIRQLVDDGVPTFGICLGHQLLALASGARTEKMKHGHHGANHPVREIATGRVLITSQNHGFAVAHETLPNCLAATHVSLFDGTLQGIRRTDRPAFGFQGHPEASPGPQDCRHLFDEFVRMMAEVRGA